MAGDNALTANPKIENIAQPVDNRVGTGDNNHLNLLDISQSPTSQSTDQVSQPTKTPGVPSTAVDAMLAGFGINDASGYSTGQYDPGNQYDSTTGTYTTPGYH
jgi:hypothetical protein